MSKYKKGLLILLFILMIGLDIGLFLRGRGAKATLQSASQTWQKVEYIKGSSSLIAFDESGGLWVYESILTSHPPKLIKYKNGEIEAAFTPADTPVLDMLSTLAFDSSGRIWLGRDTASDNGSLAVYDGRNWKTFTTKGSGLADTHIYSIAIDGYDQVWIGTDLGLNMFDGKDWKTYNSSNSGLASDKIPFIAIDSQNRIWIATYPGGVNMFDGKNWETFSDIHSNFSTPLAIDNQDRVWIGTRNSSNGSLIMNVYDGENWKTYATPSSDETRIILFDSEGNTWMQERNSFGSIMEFNGKDWTTYPAPDAWGLGKYSAPFNLVGSDPSGNIWFQLPDGLTPYNEDVILLSEAETESLINAYKFTYKGGVLYMTMWLAGAWLAIALGAWQIYPGLVIGLVAYYLGIDRFGSTPMDNDFSHFLLNGGTYITALAITMGLIGNFLKRAGNDQPVKILTIISLIVMMGLCLLCSFASFLLNIGFFAR